MKFDLVKQVWEKLPAEKPDKKKPDKKKPAEKPSSWQKKKFGVSWLDSHDGKTYALDNDSGYPPRYHEVIDGNIQPQPSTFQPLEYWMIAPTTDTKGNHDGGMKKALEVFKTEGDFISALAKQVLGKPDGDEKTEYIQSAMVFRQDELDGRVVSAEDYIDEHGKEAPFDASLFMFRESGGKNVFFEFVDIFYTEHTVPIQGGYKIELGEWVTDDEDDEDDSDEEDDEVGGVRAVHARRRRGDAGGVHCVVHVLPYGLDPVVVHRREVGR